MVFAPLRGEPGRPQSQREVLPRTAIFHARRRHGGPLTERLLHAASPVAEAPGRELWLVHRDGVTEMWASHTQCAAALDAAGVAGNAAQVMELVDRPPDVVDGEPLLRPGRRQGWAHRFRVAEEIYVAVPGAGRITVDDDAFELQPLAFGSRSPGDGELVADRQRA